MTPHRPAEAGARPSRIDDDLLDVLADALATAAYNGAQYVRGRTGDVRSLTWDVKSSTDFVSEVDTGAEQVIRDLLLGPDAARPDWVRLPVRVLGEELSADTVVGEGITFIVDPLDGTTNFLHGYPWYAVSIGALVDGVLAAGIVVNVPTGETFTARLGGGAFRDGHPITVSGITDPARALVGTGLPFKYPEHIEPYLRQLPPILRATAGVRRAGSAALDLADVACGRFDAFWELRLAPWDIAAGILLVREAGGVVTDLDGRPATVDHGPIVAGNPAMHRWLLGVLEHARTPA